MAERAPGVPLDCTIESARGLLSAFQIAMCEACISLAYGGLDLAADLRISGGEQATLYARSFLVIASRAAAKSSPSDGVHPLIDDDDGLLRGCAIARSLGYFGKSAIHPRQVPIINAAFTPRLEERAWANRV